MPKLTNVELLDTLLDNEIKKAFDELKATVAAMEEDVAKFVVKKNVSAGKRVRKSCQDAKVKAQMLRVAVMASIKSE